MDLFIVLPVLFFSIVLHEFAHGYAAYRLGDETAYLTGRLTLNPLKHIDPVGTIAVPAVCYISGLPMFGWAKPVPVNPLNFPFPRRDMAKVSAAGPSANLLLALVCAFAIKVLLVSGILSAQGTAQAVKFLVYGLQINVLLAVFNLIPIPPLDGGHIAEALLPLEASIKFTRFFGRYGMYVVLGLIITGLFRFILYPPMYLVVSLIGKIFGL